MGRSVGGGRSSGGSHSHVGGSRGSSHSHSSAGRSMSSRPSSSGRSSGLGGLSNNSSRPSRPSSPVSRPSYTQPRMRDPEPMRRQAPPPPPPIYHNTYRRPITPPPVIINNSGGGYGGYHNSSGYRRRSWTNGLIIVLIMIALTSFVFALSASRSGGIAVSTTPREKVESGNAYISDCIIDEIGWLSNEKNISSELKTFYQKTGCQPYLILKAYDSELTDAAACEAWSQDYYDSHFKDNQNVVLYTYFCDEYDEGEGMDTLFVGTQSGLVFDAEAQEIFWNTLDYQWSVEADNDQMFIKTFNNTAERIMTVTTTDNDVKKTIFVVVGVISVGLIVIVLVTKKFKRDKEKAQETIDILNSPLEEMKDSTDDLADKYINDTN